MSEVKGRNLITIPDMRAVMKVYFTGVEPPFGEEHFRRVVEEHPEYFERKFGMASVYGMKDVHGATFRVYDFLDEPENCMWRTYNFENGRELPPGESGLCNTEMMIFGSEASLLKDTGFDAVRWMKKFAYVDE